MRFLFLFLLISFSAFPQKKYKNIAYLTGNTENIERFPIAKLTHIIYSFLKLQNDTLTFHNEQQKENLKRLILLKDKYPQLKIMVSIGGWGGCAPCSDLFASESQRRTFAKTTLALFKEYHIDGLDLDWEYPAIEGYPGHKYVPADKENFTLLVKALRNEFKNDYLLSFAAGGFTSYLELSVDWLQVTPLVDFINLMTYDLVGGYSTVTGHHTPLNSNNQTIESTSKCVINLMQLQVPVSKMIIGAAFYARVWENVPDTNNGLYQSGRFKQGVAYRDFNTYFSDTSGYTYYWDKKTKAPWRYNASKKLFATFDDKRSIREKTKFIRKRKLGGIMFWELILDKDSGGLVDEIIKGLK